MAERANLALGRQVDTPGDRSADEIRRDIETTRDSIKDTVGRLNDRVEMALDWRTYVGDSPFVALSAAAGLGFLLSRVLRPRPTPRERMFEALAESVEDFTGQVRERFDRLLSQRISAGQVVKSAAAGLVTQALSAYVRTKYLGPRADSAISSATQSIGSTRRDE